MNKNTYIWINPVAAGLYAREDLDALLRRHHCTQVHCAGDWAGAVRRKYADLAAGSPGIVSDARCPMAAELVRQLVPGGHPLTVAEVEPILIHAARELAHRQDLLDGPKLITTPCAALADMGNSLGLPDTRFLPWNRLLAQWGEPAPAGRLDESPIPPGFFDGTGLAVRKVTGRDNIAAYVDGCPAGREQLVEMLYCPDGCHNGDGVLFDA